MEIVCGVGVSSTFVDSSMGEGKGVIGGTGLGVVVGVALHDWQKRNKNIKTRIAVFLDVTVSSSRQFLWLFVSRHTRMVGAARTACFGPHPDLDFAQSIVAGSIIGDECHRRDRLGTG